MRLAWIAVVAVCLCATNSAEAAKLKKGDKAPELTIKKWIKGEPVDLKKVKGDDVVVVEFWATWCRPCRKSIPHMSDMQDHFKDKGVTFIGVTDEKEKVVKAFLKGGWDKKMRYHVALDEDGQTNADWMKAAGQNGIPCAFVVHKGKVAWIGHPLKGLDKEIAELCEDEGYAKIAEEKRKKQEKFEEAMQDSQEAMQDEEWKDALKHIRKARGLQPEEYHVWLMEYALLAVKMKDKEAATKFGYELVERCDDAMALNEFAWNMMTEEEFAEARDLKLAMAGAKKALALCDEQDPAIVDTYARALFENGDLRGAIKWQKKALSLCDDDRLRKELQKALDEYEKKAEEGM